MKKFMILWVGLFILTMLPMYVFAEKIDEAEIRSKLPKLLGANNVGNDFWMTFNPCWETPGLANNVKIYVSAGVATLVTCEVPGKGFIQTQYSKPNDIIEFNLSPAIAQCYSKSDTQLPQKDHVFPGFGVHVYADDQIICYGVTRYHYTSDGFLALPTSSLGTNYICASYEDPSTSGSQNLPSEIGIVAAYDNTSVTFTCGGGQTGTDQTAGGLKSGQTAKYQMNQGDVLLFCSLGALGDLTGSIISATKPVGVIDGNFCAYIPSETPACDFIDEMELPTSMWSNFYHVIRWATKLKNPIIKIFAKQPKTNIYRDGLLLSIVESAGGPKLSGGWLEMRSDEGNPRSVVISGDKTIGVTEFCPGEQDDDVLSDPFQMVLAPPEQYQKEILFCTAGVNGDGFLYNYVSIVYQANPDGSMPQDLQYAIVENGQFTWHSFAGESSTAGDPFIYDYNGKKFNAYIWTLPGDGVYKVRANNPFIAYAYGFDDYDSYGWPTSVALGDLEKPDTVPPNPTWDENICTGAVVNGYVEDMPTDPAIRSNLAVITMNNALSFNYKFHYDIFVAGQDASTNWTLTVQDLTQDARAVITFADRRGNDTTIIINYNPAKLTIRPSFIDFGSLKPGQTKDTTLWAINESETAVTIVQQFQLFYGNQDFQIIGLNAPFTLNPMDSIPFTVRFTAGAVGSYQDSVGLGDSCLFLNKSFLEAKVAVPIINVSDWNFGDVTVGKNSSTDIVINNSGDAELVITGYSGPSNSVYTTNLPSISAASPIKIEKGQAYSFTVTFAPTAQMSYPDQIVFSSDAQTIDSICILNGRGIEGALTANSIVWNRLRIDRPGFNNDGPYPATIQYSNSSIGGIQLANNGSQQVIIQNLVINSVNPLGSDSVFEFDRTKFNSLVLKAGDVVTVPVFFHPQTVGDYELIVSYNNSINAANQTRLFGTGIVPKIATINADFDTTVVDDYTNPPQTRTITFTNVPDTYGDSLTITDLTAVAGNISYDPSQYSIDGFKFDKPSLGLPVVLHQGDSLSFSAYFIAQRDGVSTASLKSVSDALVDATSNWNGYGISQVPSITASASPTICVYDQATIHCVLILAGNSGSITVDSIRLVPFLSEFSFKDPNITKPFTMNVGDTLGFDINYQPISTGTQTTDVIVYNSSLNDQVIRVTISGTAVHYSRGTSSILNKSNVNIGDNDIVQTIALSDGPDMQLAGLQQVSVIVNYKQDFLQLLRSKITPLNNLKMSDPVYQYDSVSNSETALFTLDASPGYFDKGMNLVSIGYEAFLPSYLSNQTEIKRASSIIIYDTVAPVNNQCINITSDSVPISLNPTCANDLRPITVSSVNYSLEEIAPNPVGPNGCDVKFSVGLNGYTTIGIYNTLGALVVNIVSSDLNSGEYSIRLPIERMSSGSYWVKMQSGPYEETRELVITK